MQSLSELKQGMGELWGSVSEGWRHLRESMSGALTRFKRHGPEDDNLYLASSNWALLAGDVYEDDRKIVVRLEVPGDEAEAQAMFWAKEILAHGGATLPAFHPSLRIRLMARLVRRLGVRRCVPALGETIT